MIPISDNIVKHRQPIVTYGLIGINMALFLWELKLEVAGELGNFISNWGVVPAKVSAGIADAIGGNPAAGVAVVIFSTSLLLGMFLHGSCGQIVGNLLFLWVFGKGVEDSLGHRCYLGFYLFCGIITGLIQIIATPNLTVPLLGANGAIASILGAYIIAFPQAKIDTILPLILVYIPVELPAFFYLFWWFVQQMFYSIGSLNIGHVSDWMHGVGLILGAALMKFFNAHS